MWICQAVQLLRRPLSEEHCELGLVLLTSSTSMHERKDAKNSQHSLQLLVMNDALAALHELKLFKECFKFI